MNDLIAGISMWGFANGLPVQKFRIQYVGGVGYRDFA